MRFRSIIILIVLFISCKVFAQEERSFIIPDYSEIERLTKDEGSLFFYDNLFERYSVNDPDLSLRDYLFLYYGHFFQPDYAPFVKTQEADSIRAVFHSKNELTDDDWQTILRLAEENLKQNPFDLKGLNIVWLANQRTGNNEAAAIYLNKLKKLVQTILSSGDGITENTAFHVLNISHEYDIIHILGYEFGGQQELTPEKCDYLSLKDNSDNVHGLYFNVQQIFKGYEKP